MRHYVCFHATLPRLAPGMGSACIEIETSISFYLFFPKSKFLISLATYPDKESLYDCISFGFEDGEDSFGR